MLRRLHLSSFTRVLCLALAAVISAPGCGDSPPAKGASSAQAPPAKVGVVARVNGAEITQAEVDLELSGGRHGAPGKKDYRAALDQIVAREALSQRAAEAGLDRDPKYQEGLRRLEAQLADYRRRELAELLLRREGERRATPTEAEARAHFEKNEERIRTDVHVLQILRRSEAAIIEARSAIERGKPFEEVARDMFPGLPEGQTPWDLGYLSFSKVPEPWRATVYDMSPGEMSGILRGPNERFWLVKLVRVRRNATLDFESVREAVIADMLANRLASLREEIERDVRSKAKVEILPRPE